MNKFFFILFSTFLFNTFTLAQISSHRAEYICESKLRGGANVGTQKGEINFPLSMTFHCTIYANEQYAYIKVKVLNISLPIPLEITEASMILDYKNNIYYNIEEKIAQHIKKPLLVKTDSTSKIDDFDVIINKVLEADNPTLTVGTCEKIPWFISPGMGAGLTHGIANVKSDISDIHITKLEEFKFDFSEFLLLIKDIPISDEEVYMLKSK
jgi:hypothetical protein